MSAITATHKERQEKKGFLVPALPETNCGLWTDHSLLSLIFLLGKSRGIDSGSHTSWTDSLFCESIPALARAVGLYCTFYHDVVSSYPSKGGKPI